MEAATPLRKSSVRTVGETVAVDGLTVSDPAAVRLVRDREQRGDDPVQAFVDAVEIGARVLDREQTGADVEFVKAEFEKASREVEAAFAENAGTVGEELAQHLETVFDPERGHLARELQRHFDDGSSDAVQNQVREIVMAVMADARAEMLKQFTSADGSNPLADFKDAATGAIKQMGDRNDVHLRELTEKLAALQTELQRLRDERDKQAAVAEAEEAGTRKGRTFEEAVHEALDAIAAGQGDDCDAVGDIKGATGRTGDIVVDIEGCAGPARGRIVFEAKNSKLSRPKAMSELDEALAERDADFAVLVVPNEDKLPARTLPLREHNGDKMIVTYDPEDGSTISLQVAYSLARARVLMTRGGADGIDADAVADTAERAISALGDVRRIKSQLTGATTSIGNARSVLESMESSVRSQLEQIAALVASGADGPEDED